MPKRSGKRPTSSMIASSSTPKRVKAWLQRLERLR
ncbi:hypothetical protein PI125_g24040 [Phytophthora idaei]|nr:hypothetical protein PI125_g24040 [Phytophthora idaei]